MSFFMRCVMELSSLLGGIMSRPERLRTYDFTVFFADDFFAVDFFDVFLDALAVDFRLDFFVDFLVPFFEDFFFAPPLAASLARRSDNNSPARASVIASGVSPRRKLALVSPSVT